MSESSASPLLAALGEAAVDRWHVGCFKRRCRRTLSADSPTTSPHSGHTLGAGFVFFTYAVDRRSTRRSIHVP